MSTPPPPPVTPIILPNRGRSLIATRKISPGEVILTDSPLLTYPSVYPSPSFCSSCFRTLNTNTSISCSNIHPCLSLFCSTSCFSSHSPTLCHYLSSSSSPFSSDSLFLFAAHSLSLSSPPSFSLLLSLHKSVSNVEVSNASSLPTLFPADTTAMLLSIDRLNAFAIMDPFTEGGERRVRGYGIYGNAALFNHDCLPNSCRFDYEGGREIVVRAIHEISEGREVCLSYFPVNWGYKERQERLREDYGFECQCDRCMIEKDWKDVDDDNDDVMMDGSGEEEEEGDFPHAFFFAKFLCDREDCGGTLAPLPPSGGVVSDVFECNVCGKLKKDEEEDLVDDGDMIDGE